MRSLLIDNKRLFTIAINFLIIAIVFDNSRMVLRMPNVLNSMISLLRDCIIFILFAVLLLDRKFSVLPISILIFITLFPIPIFIYIANVIDNNSQTTLTQVLRGLYWLIRPFLVLYILYNSKNYYTWSKSDSIKIFILACCGMFFFSCFIYFLFLSIVASMHFENRISLGNPSMIGTLYDAAVILLFRYMPFKTRSKNIFALCILCLGCIATLSATANVILILIFAIALAEKRTRAFTMFFLVLILIPLAIICIKIGIEKIAVYTNFFMKRANEVFNTIGKYIFHINEDVGSDSMRGRELQISKMWKTFEFENFLFGCGDISGTGGRFSIENTYFALFTNLGIVGICAYGGILFSILKAAVIECFRKKRYALFQFLFFLGLYGLTLDLINTFSLANVFIITAYWLLDKKDIDC